MIMTIKEEIKKIMKDNYIFGSDCEDAIQFVHDLLELRTKKLEENEPYATKTIKRLKEAAYEVRDLESYIWNALDDLEEE